MSSKHFERANIQAMAGYASGEQPLDAKTIKLNTNENPYPPSPKVSEVLSGFNIERLRRYPPPTAAGFRQVAAEVHNVSADQIIATRGGDELLRLVITTFVEPGETIAMTEPTYSLYPVLAQIQNCPILKVPLQTNHELAEDFADKANAAGAKLTFVVNPHAPTGHLLSVQTLDKLATELDGLLLIDEAYIDFVSPDRQYNCLALLQRHDNVIFLRTLSKGYGLAGLRFGYGIAQAHLITPMMDKTRDSYNLDLISQEIASAALADQTYAQHNWRLIIEERENLVLALTEMGYSCLKSETNFLLVTVDANRGANAEALYRALKDQLILVRYFDHPGMTDKLRISVGTPSENSKLIRAIKTLLT